MIKIDLEKALEIHKTQIRKKRDELFPSLDVQFMRALEVGNAALSTEVGLKKQALRDITDIDINSVTTLDELKALWNEELLGPSPYTK
jgi:hypothetical protein